MARELEMVKKSTSNPAIEGRTTNDGGLDANKTWLSDPTRLQVDESIEKHVLLPRSQVG